MCVHVCMHVCARMSQGKVNTSEYGTCCTWGCVHMHVAHLPAGLAFVHQPVEVNICSHHARAHLYWSTRVSHGTGGGVYVYACVSVYACTPALHACATGMPGVCSWLSRVTVPCRDPPVNTQGTGCASVRSLALKRIREGCVTERTAWAAGVQACAARL